LQFKDDVIPPNSLVTVIAAEHGVPISQEWLEGRLADMNDGCDVYQKDHFFDALVITGVSEGHHNPAISETRETLLAALRPTAQHLAMLKDENPHRPDSAGALPLPGPRPEARFPAL
jgi:hypothetical protein